MIDFTPYRNRNATIAISCDGGATIVLPTGQQLAMEGREAAWAEIDLEEVPDLSEMQVRAVQLAEEQAEVRAQRAVAQAQRNAESAAVQAQLAADRAAYWASTEGERMARRQVALRRLLNRFTRLAASLHAAQ